MNLRADVSKRPTATSVTFGHMPDTTWFADQLSTASTVFLKDERG
jgi:hypothetical protein